jgi:nucleotide-binding universal stress UspA family protein
MSETPPGPASAPVTSSDRRSVIVVGYSASAEGRAALQRALSEATLRGSELVVVHTARDAEISELTERLQVSGVPHEVLAAHDTHDPADEVLRAAESTAAEFIVIGLRRRSPVGKLLLGSNAQRVLLDAACPVLAVKAAPDA